MQSSSLIQGPRYRSHSQDRGYENGFVQAYLARHTLYLSPSPVYVVVVVVVVGVLYMSVGTKYKGMY